MRTGWRLGVTLMLLGAGALVLRFAPPVRGEVNPVSLFALPAALGEWTGVEGVPEGILPSDPNEKLSVRRTYRQGGRVAWVSVALFVGQDDEARRASINKLYPQRGVSLIEPVALSATLYGPAAAPVALPAVIVHQDPRRLLVAYWHQIGPRVYGNEYRFRLALMRDLIFARRADSLLIRIATETGQDPSGADGVGAVAALAPAVRAGLGQEAGR